MYLTRLRYFVTTAEEGSVVQAARRLHLAQPALTRQLHILEREVGTPLFERHARGVRLLPAGVSFLEHARRLLLEAQSGIDAARRSAGGAKQPPIRVSPPDWPHRAMWVRQAVEDLAARHPDATVEYMVTPWLQHVPAVLDGSIDVGFAVAVSATDFGGVVAAEWLCDEPGSRAVVPLSHPLAKRASLRLTDLRDLPALLPSHESAPMLHDQMLAMIRSGGYEPRVGRGGDSFSATMQQVVVGAGWVLVVRSIGNLPAPGTAVIPLADANIMLGLYLVRRTDDDRPLVAEFVDCLRGVIALEAPQAAAGD